MVFQEVLPLYLLFECASGYALFLAPGLKLTDVGMSTFKSAEEYLSEELFQLMSFYPFKSDDEALAQMKAIAHCKLIFGV